MCGRKGIHDLVGPLYKDKDGINTYMLVHKNKYIKQK